MTILIVTWSVTTGILRNSPVITSAEARATLLPLRAKRIFVSGVPVSDDISASNP